MVNICGATSGITPHVWSIPVLPLPVGRQCSRGVGRCFEVGWLEKMGEQNSETKCLKQVVQAKKNLLTVSSDDHYQID